MDNVGQSLTLVKNVGYCWMLLGDVGIVWQRGRKFMVAVQQPHIYKTPRLVSLEGSTFQKFATYISFIIWVLNKSTKFSQVSSSKIENLISGAPNKSTDWKIFEKR